MLALALSLLSVASPSHAAWVWVYGGNKHVVLPPEEGQPPWASYPDANHDGRPDPIITEVRLTVQDEQGQPLARARLGQTLVLVAVPELGALEEEPLTVRFYLVGPGGELAVVPDEDVAQPTPVGTAPATYRARYHLPEDPAEGQVGDYEARVEVTVGGVTSPGGSASTTRLKVLAPKESAPDKLRRSVRHGLQDSGTKLSRFGQRIADGVVSVLSLGAPPEPAQLHRLREAGERESLGMAREATQTPGSPLADKESLACDRAAAVRSGAEPLRSLVVIPIGKAEPPTEAGGLPLGYLALQGLRPALPLATASRPGDGTMLVTARDRPFHLYRLVLKAQPAATDGLVSLVTADGAVAVDISARIEWRKVVPWPGACLAHTTHQPDNERDGAVAVEVLAAVPDGAVRVMLSVPVAMSSEP